MKSTIIKGICTELFIETMFSDYVGVAIAISFIVISTLAKEIEDFISDALTN